MSKQDKNAAQKSAYPTQPPAMPAYPQQTAYLSYNPIATPVPNPMMPGMPAPPPSYDQAMQHPVAPPNYNPAWNNGYPQPGAPMSYQQYAPGMAYPQPMQNPYMPTHNPYQAQFPPQPAPSGAPATVVVHNAFDAGARFDSTSQATIPPPPPGVAPNAAQLAQANGQNVVAGQRPNKWFMGGSDGGAVFW